jgi:hypothetical protein
MTDLEGDFLRCESTNSEDSHQISRLSYRRRTFPAKFHDLKVFLNE